MTYPDCKEKMVKSRIAQQEDDGSTFYLHGWLCGCKDEEKYVVDCTNVLCDWSGYNTDCPGVSLGGELVCPKCFGLVAPHEY